MAAAEVDDDALLGCQRAPSVFGAVTVLAFALFVTTPGDGSSQGGSFPGRNGRILFPAGTNLGFLDEQPRGFYTVTPRGRQLRRLLKWVPFHEGPSSVQWSPDGHEVVFVSGCGITVAMANGSKRRCVAGTKHYSDPSWSPDGSQFAATAFVAGDDEIVIVTGSGGLLTRISIEVGHPLTPSWSPTGDQIAFVALNRENYKTDVYAMRRDGTALERLTTDGMSTRPSWSPDGTRILLVKGLSQVWVMDADGSNKRRLLVVPRASVNDNVDDLASAVWSPDGTKIAYSSSGARWISIFTLRTRTRREIRLALPRGVVVGRYDPLDWQPIRR